MTDSLTRTLLATIVTDDMDATIRKVAENVARKEAEKILSAIPDVTTATIAEVDHFIATIESSWA